MTSTSTARRRTGLAAVTTAVAVLSLVAEAAAPNGMGLIAPGWARPAPTAATAQPQADLQAELQAELQEDEPPGLPEGRELDLPDTPIAPGAAAGYLPGAGQVSPDGQFTYDLPLEVPAGRAGMQPSLSLHYTSGPSDGPLGVGWSLTGGGGMIERCGSTMADSGVVKGVTFDGADHFCLGGQKCPPSATESCPSPGPGGGDTPIIGEIAAGAAYVVKGIDLFLKARSKMPGNHDMLPPPGGHIRE